MFFVVVVVFLDPACFVASVSCCGSFFVVFVFVIAVVIAVVVTLVRTIHIITMNPKNKFKQ